MNIIAIIPARAGSKGIPGKNMALCGGKPLVQWSIEAAQKAKRVSMTVVSSDSPGVLALASSMGVIAQGRPAKFAADDSSTEDVIGYVLRQTGVPDVVVLLQPTSPVRTGLEIDQAIQLLVEGGWNSVVSLCRSHHLLWGPTSTKPDIEPRYDVLARSTRQQVWQYTENGSIYVFTGKHWETMHNRLGGNMGRYIMPEESLLQVDTPLDLYLVDKILERLGRCSLGTIPSARMPLLIS